MITLDSISHLNHSIAIVDAAGDALAIAADGSIAVTDNGGSLTVDGTVELGATTLAALETITVLQGTSPWVVSGTVELGATTLAALESITVVATDLDIRDLTSASDSVAAVQSGAWSVSVSALPGSLQGYAEDAAHTSGDFGVMGLAVRRDANTSLVGTDGDYSALQVNSLGALKVGIFDSAGDQLAINADGSFNVQTNEAGYASWSVIQATIDDTVGGTQIAAAPLSGRLRIEIQNLGSQDLYIRQSTGVTTGNGLKIPKGSSYEQALDSGAAVYAITPSGSSDVRIAQYAA